MTERTTALWAVYGHFYKGTQTGKQVCQCRIGGFAYFELRHFIRGNVYATFAPAHDLGLKIDTQMKTLWATF